MKNKSLFLYLSLFLVLLTTGCTITSNPVYQESDYDKIAGNWYYTRATFTKNFSYSVHDVMAAYQDVEFTFYADGTVYERNNRQKLSSTGTFELGSQVLTDQDGYSYTSKYLDGLLIDDATRQLFSLDWQDMDIRNNRISFREYTQDGTYSFVLERFN